MREQLTTIDEFARLPKEELVLRLWISQLDYRLASALSGKDQTCLLYAREPVFVSSRKQQRRRPPRNVILSLYSGEGSRALLGFGDPSRVRSESVNFSRAFRL